MNWRPYWHIFAASAREDSVNPRRMVMGVGVTFFRVFLLSAIYAVAYKYGRAGLSYQNAIWSLGVYFAFILNLGIRDLFQAVEQDVQSGEVELQLIKPLDWRVVKVCQVIGKNGVEFIVQLVVLPIYLILLVGLPDTSFWSPLFLAQFVVLVVFAIISACCLFMTVGLASFWLNDSSSLFRILDKTILVFGGGFVPIALLPTAVQAVTRFSPTGVYAAPTQLFNPGVVPVLTGYLLSALFWTVILIMFNNYVWKRAQLRIEVNGG